MSVSANNEQGMPNGRRILVADDDPILRELMQAKLSGPGTTVVCAANGVEAWSLLARDQFHLAIIDLGMPKLDGFGLISHLRQTPKTIDLPVVVATSRDDNDAIERAYMAGATSFITKPINWTLLSYQVQFVLRNGEIERDLRRARVVADTASRTKDSMFRLLGSELRTPLHILVGFADVFETQLARNMSKDQLEHLQHMRDAARHLANVVSDVLTYSKLFGGDGTLKTTECDADELIENCAVSLKPKARERSVQTVVRRLLEPVVVNADPRLIADALARLAGNAVKFSPVGGTVELRAGLQEDRSLVLVVRDNGPGMDQRLIEERLQSLPQPDTPPSRPDNGLGLGIPIVRKIAELHGGKLLFKSAPGEGTVAALWLPNSLCRLNRLAEAG